jgi:hypothetical protein
MIFSFEYRNFWWVSKVQWAFQSRELYPSVFVHDGLAVGPLDLECAKSLLILSGD